MREGLRCAWIRTAKELDQLGPQWDALWKEDRHATPFQSPAWLLPWWQIFGEQLRSVGIFRGSELRGLLPFYLYREPATGERKLLPLGVGTTDYLDGVFAPDCTVADVEDAIEFLCTEPEWDAIHVPQLRAGSRLFAALERTGCGGRLIPGESCSRMAAVALSGLPPKIRRNAMYYRNRALRAGALELEVAGGSNWSDVFGILVRLHTERWDASGNRGVFADERVTRWHREALPLLDHAGILRLFALRLDGETIGALYSLIDPPDRRRRTQYFYLPAYSIRHADLRPGTLLTALAVEHASQEGVEIIDMLRGDEEYKRLWHTERVPTFGFVRYRDRAALAGEIAA
jgi:CelD/BcsL family acetyltransferase involved in cellulose biosynthesis